MRIDLIRFSLRTLLLLVLIVGIDRSVLGSRYFLSLLYKYRPGFDAYSKNSFVEKQALALELIPRGESPLLVLTGSSSVVNGIDPEILQENLPNSSLSVVNVGMTGLLASELPHLRKYLLDRNVHMVVYLYNTFSFANSFHPDGSRTRWSTAEFLSEGSLSLFWKNKATIIEGTLSQMLYSIKYRNLIRELVSRKVLGTLSTQKSDFDYPEDEEITPIRNRNWETPLDSDTWDRRIYIESDRESNSLGYIGLKRFIELAKEQNKTVVVMPVPEPEFSFYGKYKRGISPSKIDARVTKLCAEQSAICISRSEIADLELDDKLFRDDVHLHHSGRSVFSIRLAKLLKNYIPSLSNKTS